MIENYTKIYEGDGFQAPGAVLYLPLLFAGTIKGFDVKVEAANTQTAVFRVLLNDVALPDDLILPEEAEFVSLDNLDIVIQKGDELVLSLVSGGINAPPLSFNVRVESGESAGGGVNLPAGDLNAAINKLEKIQGTAIFIESGSAGISDDFGDGIVADYLDIVGNVSEADGVLKILANSSAAFKENYDFREGFISFKIAFGGSGFLRLTDSVNNHNLQLVDLIGAAGFLRTQIDYGGNQDTAVSTGERPDNQYLRLRHSGNNFFVDTSADGAVWNQKQSRAVPSGMDCSNLQIAFINNDGAWTLDNFHSTLGRSVGLADKDLFWFNENTNRIERVALDDLKAALGLESSGSAPEILTDTGAARTILTTDAGKIVRMTNAAATVITLNNDLTASIAAGKSFSFLVDSGSAAVSWTAGSGVTITPAIAGHTKISAGGAATVFSTGEGAFKIIGATE